MEFKSNIKNIKTNLKRKMLMYCLNTNLINVKIIFKKELNHHLDQFKTYCRTILLLKNKILMKIMQKTLFNIFVCKELFHYGVDLETKFSL